MIGQILKGSRGAAGGLNLWLMISDTLQASQDGLHLVQILIVIFLPLP
jgi:hypothetical protein